jgi:hypothetical protein
MSDELTPEERKAIDSLPRERMPARLEGRVVDAMREHGFLAKRRRTIVLTNGRVAGVLAASVAVMIGAYSIGLHRGGVEEALRAAAPMGTQAPGSLSSAEDDGRVRVQTPSLDAIKPESKPLESKDALRSEDLQKQTRTNQVPATNQPATSEGLASTIRSDESKKDLDWQLKSKEEGSAQGTVASPLQAEPARATDRARPPQPSALAESAQRPFTYVLDGKTIVVEAPDSVRIVEDKQGRMLLIYTSDGIIRIRLAD